MAPTPDASPPKDDSDYFGRLSKAIFTAGLNWSVIEKKWPGFEKAFADFSPEKVSKMSEARIRALTKDPRIVRNERKIRATVENARAVISLQKEYGSFEEYVHSFGRQEERLQEDLQNRFKHLGPSTARSFLWMVGYHLTPTKEEKMWMKGHGHKEK
jgi:DNA-3-methyladenine glycosylase I